MTHGLVVGRWVVYVFYFDEFYLADPLCVGLQWNNSRLLKCCTAILQGPSLLVRQVCFTLSINILMSMSQALDDPTSSRLADSQTWKWLKHVPTHLLQNQLQENKKKTTLW